VENSRNEKACHQNTWSSGTTAFSKRKVSTNEKLSLPALGRSSSYHSHSSKAGILGPVHTKSQMEEKDNPLRTLWENPNHQLKKSTNGQEDPVPCEDSGYLSTFGGRSSELHQYLPRTFLSNNWDQDEQMTFQEGQQDMDDLDSMYTEDQDGVRSLLRQNQIQATLIKVLSGKEESIFEAANEKNKNMNKKKRIVKKGGTTNVSFKNISKKKRRFCSDLYTTLLDASWTFSVIMFSASFYGSWILFGALYFSICYWHGDFVEEGTDWVPCIQEVDGFASSFLFSLETQHTIGYGSRQTTTECPLAMAVVSIQAVIGCILQAFLVGLIFSKLSKPRSRSKTIIFSNQAVVTLRNGRLCVIFRIGDLRNESHLLGTKISLRMIRRKITEEGEIYQDMENLKVTPDTNSESCLLFVWPLDIVHLIDKDSPFYEMSAADLAKDRFELVLIMEGTNETSNMTFQARTSYLPQEILWGHRFEQLVIYRRDQNKFQVNYSAFHSTYEVNTPLCSAKDLDMLRNGKHLSQKVPMIHTSPSRTMLSDVSRNNFVADSFLHNR